jgi:hypothetical protein
MSMMEEDEPSGLTLNSDNCLSIIIPETPQTASDANSDDKPTSPKVGGKRGREKKDGGRMRFRSYCITHFYKEEFEVARFAEDLKALPGVIYFLLGREISPSTGNKHLQGYIQFKNPIDFNSLCEKFTRTNFLVANGSDEENVKYCMKEGDFIEWGKREKRAGTRKAASVRGIMNHFDYLFMQMDEFRDLFEDEELLEGLSKMEHELLEMTDDVSDLISRWSSDDDDE